MRERLPNSGSGLSGDAWAASAAVKQPALVRRLDCGDHYSQLFCPMLSGANFQSTCESGKSSVGEDTGSPGSMSNTLYNRGSFGSLTAKHKTAISPCADGLDVAESDFREVMNNKKKARSDLPAGLADLNLPQNYASTITKPNSSKISAIEGDGCLSLKVTEEPAIEGGRCLSGDGCLSLKVTEENPVCPASRTWGSHRRSKNDKPGQNCRR